MADRAFEIVMAIVFWSLCIGAAYAAYLVWRDDAPLWLTLTRSSDEAVRRGHQRGVVPFAAAWLLFVGSMTAEPFVGLGAGVAGIFAFMVGLLLHFLIVWFNRPRFLVPPHMRDDVGVLTAWWRGRAGHG